MKHNFQLPDFPGSNFAIETSIWNRRSKLYVNNFPVAQSKEIGKPFLIPKANGGFVKAFERQSFTAFFVPELEINGKQNRIVEKLNWIQYTIGVLPLSLLFSGGAIGGAIGTMGTLATFCIFTQEGSQLSKYIKAIGAIVSSFLLYFLFFILIWKLLN